jgi:hypothetical protein
VRLSPPHYSIPSSSTPPAEGSNTLPAGGSNTTPPERPSSGWFDYLLMAGTGVLFLLYLPLFFAVPYLAPRDLQEGHLLWALPLLMICACLGAFCAWLWHGPIDVVRVVWTLAFALAVLGYPAAVLSAMFGNPRSRSTRDHSGQRPPDPPPERIEPMRLP